jgi:hypothetical protein
MYRKVADNLLWCRFQSTFQNRANPNLLQTTIAFHGSNFNGVFADWLAAVFRQDAADIVFKEDDERQPWYHLDEAKKYNPCLQYLVTLP